MARPIDYSNAERRWAGLGPYYAMFPREFADDVVRRYTEEGDLVLDPFAGRGTSIFSAATQNRIGIGIEINPVGYVYARTKLAPADLDAVIGRVRHIDRASTANCYAEEADALPLFFRRCFAPRVRQFLLAARQRLNWRQSSIDRTTMAILLVYLHGKDGAAFSNQMRQAKAMSPDYAIRWWAERSMSPPEVDPIAFLAPRIEWRYAKGKPNCSGSSAYLGNSLTILPRLGAEVTQLTLPTAKLLFTSPPYYGVTNYHYDQWLRLWLLGGPPHARRNGNGRCGKFEHRDNYKILLEQIFARSKRILHRDAIIYVRTDARKFTRDTTISVLGNVFPEKRISVRHRPIKGATQTQLFGGCHDNVGEIDLVLTS